MQKFDASPHLIFAALWRYRDLVRAMVVRDIVGRYRGSVMGLAWSFLNPVFMLLVYTFVFSVIFKSRWSEGASESRADFAIILFVGIIVHGLFAECVNRAPGMIVSHTSFVKKVVFPLEILPWVALGSALFHALASVVVLMAVQLAFRHHVPWTAILFPIVLIPLVLATMGTAWFLTALGVFVRDMGQITAMATMILMFLSPVFYPVSALPPALQGWFHLNPLTYIIEASRATLVFGELPSATQWAGQVVLGLLIAWAGFAWFQKSRAGFADVL